jgi:transcriptional regulator with XRE-family HTH domain
MSHFGELLIKYRQCAGLTQKELGEKVGVDDSYISRLERGVYQPPTREVVLKLADALGISGKIRRFVFFLAAYVAGYEDMEGLTLVEATEEEAPGGLQPAIAGTEALGSGVGLGALLSRYRKSQQQIETASQQLDQNIGLLVERTVTEAQLSPEKRILAGRLILENARSVCEVLAKE